MKLALALFTAVAIAGCSMLGLKLAASDCDQMVIAQQFAEQLLHPKCDVAEDPVTEPHCLAISGMAAAIASCRLAAAADDSAALAAAKADFRDARASAGLNVAPGEPPVP